jgi:predicted Rossmann-fold nucleotide-binding protein
MVHELNGKSDEENQRAEELYARQTKSTKRESGIIVEIDARALARTYGTISHVPSEFWDFVAKLGTSIIWLKCPWQESPLSFDLMQKYSRLHNEVLSGENPVRMASGYDVFKYELNPKVAESDEEFVSVVKRLREMGMALILDFVTNHIAADSPYITEVPGLVRSGNRKWVVSQARRFFPDEFKDVSDEEVILRSLNKQYPSFSKTKEGFFIQHARMDADSKGAENLAQINYLDERARRFMIDFVLDKIARLTVNGGLRADLAYLAFRLTLRDFWGFGISWSEFERLIPKEFWQELKERVDERYPGMSLFAETYGQGNIETFVSLGFNPYNKIPYDLLVAGDIANLRAYLLRAKPDQMKQWSSFLANCINCTEDHDESAAPEAFRDREHMLAASVILWSIPGFELIPLRQIFGMGKPEGAVLEMKSADGGIYPFQYPDVTKVPDAVVSEIPDIMHFISLPVMRQGEMDHAPVQEIKLGGNVVGMSQTGLVAFTRNTPGEHALVLVNDSWEQKVEISVARSGEGVLKAQCLSQGANVQIMEKEIKVILSPWQYCLLAFGQQVSVPNDLTKPDGGYNGWSVERTLAKMANEVKREMTPSEKKLIMPEIKEAAKFLVIEDRINGKRGPPLTVWMIDSNEEAFGAYYDPAENKLYIRTAILNKSAYSLILVMVHELNGKSEEENKKAENRYILDDTYPANSCVVAAITNGQAVGDTPRVDEDIMRERQAMIKTTHQWEQAITVLGGARVKPGHVYYELGIKLGREMARMRITPRTGAGPGIMAAVPEGYLDEMKKIADSHHLTQGIRIVLPFEAEVNPYVQVHENYKRFLTRLDALEENTKGVIFLPGGMGTLNELFDCWDKGISMAFLGKEFWGPILGAFVKLLQSSGMEGHLNFRISYLITDDPQEAIKYVASESKKNPRQRTTKGQFKVINEEMQRALGQLDQWGRAVVVEGNSIQIGPYIELTKQLVAHAAEVEGTSIRVASPSIYPEVLTFARQKGWPQRVHAVLYARALDNQPEEMRTTGETDDQNQLMIINNKSNHLLLTAYNGAAYVFTPGAVGTFNRFFSLLTIMQTKKVRRRPILLVGRDSWQPFFDVLKRQMLSDAFGGTCPDGLNLISPEDMDLFKIVDQDNLPEIKAYLQEEILLQRLEDRKDSLFIFKAKNFHSALKLHPEHNNEQYCARVIWQFIKLLFQRSSRFIREILSQIFDREVLIKRAQEKFDEFLRKERDKNNISSQVYERLASRDTPQVQGYVNFMFVMMIAKAFTIPLNLIFTGGVIGQAMFSIGDRGHWLIGAGLILLFNAAFEGLIIFYLKRMYQWSLSESFGLLILVNVVGLIPWVGTFLAVPLFLELKSFWQRIWYKQPRPEAIGKFWELLGVYWKSLIGRVAERIIDGGRLVTSQSSDDSAKLLKDKRSVGKYGLGCSGNVSPENAGVIKERIVEKAFKEVNVGQKIFEGIVDVPVKVFVLTKQVPRAPPGGFIWDRLVTRDGITTLEIYYSSKLVYKRNKDLIVEDAYHGFIENRQLQNPRNKLTPTQAHTKATQKTAKRFPQSASRMAARFAQPPLWERWRRECHIIDTELERYLQGILREKSAGIAQHHLDFELTELKQKIADRNTDLKDRLWGVKSILSNGGANGLMWDREQTHLRPCVDVAEGCIWSALRLNVIKGEPDLKGIHGVLAQARESLKKGKSVEGPFNKVRAIIAKSNLLFKAWIDYEQELIDAELNASVAVNRVDMLKEIFPRFLRGLLDEERTIIGSVVERAIFWARLYQAIFIPFKIDVAQQDERVSNPVFEAATFYRYILEIGTIAEFLDRSFMKAGVNTATFLRRIRDAGRTHIVREDLPELMMAIAKDFRLNDEQSKLLEGGVYFEPRENKSQTLNMRVALEIARYLSGLGLETAATAYKEAAEDIDQAIHQWYLMNPAAVQPSSIDNIAIAEVIGQGIYQHPAFIYLRTPDFVLKHEQWHRQYPNDDELSIGCRHVNADKILLKKAYRAVSKFKTRDFSPIRVVTKAEKLLSYEGLSSLLVHNYIRHVLAGIQEGDNSKVFGISGEISGIYEVIFKRGTELNDIKFGDLQGIDIVVLMKDRDKEFDAVSSNTVFEFKFHLSLLKLYQQVIGGVIKTKLPHLRVLLDDRFRDIRNLVYFGENDNGSVAPAIQRYLEKNPNMRKGLTVTDKGFAFKIALDQLHHFLFSEVMLKAARDETFSLRVVNLGRVEIFAKKLIQRKIDQLGKGEHFDVIIGVSNAKPAVIEALRHLSLVEVPAMLPGSLCLPSTYAIGYPLFWFLRIITLGGFKTGEENIRRWIQLYAAPFIEARKFEKLSVEQLMFLHRNLPGDPQRRLAGILKIKQEIEKGYREGGWSVAFVNNVIEHHLYNLRNPESVLAFGSRSRGMTSVALLRASDKKASDRDSENKRDKIIIVIMALLLLVLLAFFLCRIFMWPFCPCRCACRLPALVTVWLKGPSSSLSMKWLRIIQYRWWRFYSVSICPMRALYCRAWQFCFKEITWCFYAWYYCWSLLENTPCNGIIFNPEQAYLFLYIVLCSPLFLDWWYFRWVHHSIRTIYVTIFKVVITAGERHFMLGIRTLLGGNTNSPGFWTGFNNLIAPVISACTYNISYTSTTYAYTIIV